MKTNPQGTARYDESTHQWIDAEPIAAPVAPTKKTAAAAPASTAADVTKE